MPIYEYRCHKCRRRSSVLVRTLGESSSPACEHCGSQEMTRLISRFSFHRSWGSSLNWAPGSEGFGAADPDNPREMSQWLRRMRHEMGDEVTPEFDNAIDEMEAEVFAEEHGYGDDDLDGDDLL